MIQFRINVPAKLNRRLICIKFDTDLKSRGISCLKDGKPKAYGVKRCISANKPHSKC